MIFWKPLDSWKSIYFSYSKYIILQRWIIAERERRNMKRNFNNNLNINIRNKLKGLMKFLERFFCIYIYGYKKIRKSWDIDYWKIFELFFFCLKNVKEFKELCIYFYIDIVWYFKIFWKPLKKSWKNIYFSYSKYIILQ